MDRRRFLIQSALAASGQALAAAIPPGIGDPVPESAAPPDFDPGDWKQVRAQFDLDPDYVHLAALLIASHPRQVRAAIDSHRRELDRSPLLHLQQQNRVNRERVLAAASGYLGVRPEEIALTSSTTIGLGLVYNGIRLNPWPACGASPCIRRAQRAEPPGGLPGRA